MQSLGRAHPLHIPMVPAGPLWSDRDREGGGGVSVPTRPAKQHGGGSPLRLLPIVPWPTSRARTPAPHAAGTPHGYRLGGEAERRLHFRHGPPPPLGERDTLLRLWALSPPGTTDRRRLAGRSRGLGL